MKTNLATSIRLLFVLTLAVVPVSAQMGLIQQGRAAISRGDSDAAINILEKAVSEYPESAEAHFCLFTAYGTKAINTGMFAMAKYGQKAKAACEKTVALNPKHAEARFGLVQIYALAPGFMGGSQEKALAQAKELKALDPVLGHRAYAFMYAQQKKYDLARKEYVEAIRLHPNSAKAHSYFGQYLANTEKNYTGAFVEFDTALKVDPNYMPAVYHVGRTASLSGANLTRGEQALKKYLAYTPRENEPPLSNAQYHLGSIYEKQGRKPEAKQSYQAVLKVNPTHKQASVALKRVP